MAVITLSEVKVFLQIGDTSKDALITALIPIVEDEIKAYTNQEWADPWPVWMKIPVAELINVQLQTPTNGMKSESQGGYSYTRESADATKAALMKLFDKVRMARIGKQSIKENYRDTRGWNAQELVTHQPAQGVQDANYPE
jgi:hypothetical protein